MVKITPPSMTCLPYPQQLERLIRIGVSDDRVITHPHIAFPQILEYPTRLLVVAVLPVE